mmetsp:Transcript_96264/g.310603  ORF Transcript_96264/g.310603 Transcript_96264/m.310603 type:complete len:302 (-) Transcript_96264:7-912(-)
MSQSSCTHQRSLPWTEGSVHLGPGPQQSSHGFCKSPICSHNQGREPDVGCSTHISTPRQQEVNHVHAARGACEHQGREPVARGRIHRHALVKQQANGFQVVQSLLHPLRAVHLDARTHCEHYDTVACTIPGFDVSTVREQCADCLQTSRRGSEHKRRAARAVGRVDVSRALQQPVHSADIPGFAGLHELGAAKHETAKACIVALAVQWAQGFVCSLNLLKALGGALLGGLVVAAGLVRMASQSQLPVGLFDLLVARFAPNTQSCICIAAFLRGDHSDDACGTSRGGLLPVRGHDTHSAGDA